MRLSWFWVGEIIFFPMAGTVLHFEFRMRIMQHTDILVAAEQCLI